MTVSLLYHLSLIIDSNVHIVVVDQLKYSPPTEKKLMGGVKM